MTCLLRRLWSLLRHLWHVPEPVAVLDHYGVQTPDDIVRIGRGIATELGTDTLTDRAMVRYFTETRVVQLERQAACLEAAAVTDPEYTRDVSRRVGDVIPRILGLPVPRGEWRLPG